MSETVTVPCANCGGQFSMLKEANRRRRKDGKGFPCPNCGGSNVYNKLKLNEIRDLKVEVSKLKKDYWNMYQLKNRVFTELNNKTRLQVRCSKERLKYKKQLKALQEFWTIT